MPSYPDRLKLGGATAIVVGAAPGGMGGETALALADAGAHVVAVDLRSELADATVSAVHARGGTATGMACNALDSEQVREVVHRVRAERGRLDVLVNVVGGTLPETWRHTEDVDDSLLETAYDFNVGAMFRPSREVARVMIADGTGGRIVNFASMSGVVSAPYHAVYGAAKAAVMSMTRTMAVEWGRHGIRVNAIAPGAVTTQHVSTMNSFAWGDEVPTPLGRLTYKEEVASVALFLASDLSGSMTGQILNVDAGSSARSPIGDLALFEPRILPRGASS